MRKIAIGCVLTAVLAGLAVVDGQTITDTFQRVRITSAATDALTVSGGVDVAGALNIGNPSPQIYWHESDAPLNAKYWRAIADSSAWCLQTLNDLATTPASIFCVGRSATTPGAMTWGTTQHLSPTGAAAAPSYSAVGDGNTGIWFPGLDLVGVSTGGINRSTWSAAGQTNTVPFLAPVGSGAGPGVAFADDSDTGLYQEFGNTMSVAVGGVRAATVDRNLGSPRILTPAAGYDSVGPGTSVRIGFNSTGAGAAGFLQLEDRNGTTRAVWQQAGLLRIHTNAPNVTDSLGSAHTDGVVVGDQTSFLASKDLLGQPTDASLLDAVLRTPVHHFRYKDGRYNNETFTGIVTDEAPHFAKDNGKALNEINGLGYLIGAVRELERRLAASEARVRQLEARE